MGLRILSSIIAFTCLSALSGYAQISPTGLVFNDQVYDTVSIVPSDSVRGGKLPYRVSLRQYCPTPGDQGLTAACVGWALANTLTIERMARAKQTDQNQINARMHSVAYIYNQIKLGDCKAGAYLHAGIELLKEQGDCLATEFEYTNEDCFKNPTEFQRRKAALYATKGYERLFKTTDDVDYKIDAIRTILARGKPVLIAAVVPADFKYNTLEKLDWKGAKQGHALVVVGYDDGKKEFELMNSYGTTWGDHGFFRLNYYLLASCVRYGYQLLLNEGIPTVKR